MEVTASSRAVTSSDDEEAILKVFYESSPSHSQLLDNTLGKENIGSGHHISRRDWLSRSPPFSVSPEKEKRSSSRSRMYRALSTRSPSRDRRNYTSNIHASHKVSSRSPSPSDMRKKRTNSFRIHQTSPSRSPSPSDSRDSRLNSSSRYGIHRASPSRSSPSSDSREKIPNSSRHKIRHASPSLSPPSSASKEKRRRRHSSSYHISRETLPSSSPPHSNSREKNLSHKIHQASPSRSLWLGSSKESRKNRLPAPQALSSRSTPPSDSNFSPDKDRYNNIKNVKYA